MSEQYGGRVWSEGQIAHWLHNGPVSMTLSEAWALARLVAQGPLADSYLIGKRDARRDMQT